MQELFLFPLLKQSWIGIILAWFFQKYGCWFTHKLSQTILKKMKDPYKKANPIVVYSIVLVALAAVAIAYIIITAS